MQHMQRQRRKGSEDKGEDVGEVIELPSIASPVTDTDAEVKAKEEARAKAKESWNVTPNRTLRMDDETWFAAKAQAAKDGIPLTRVIRYYLRAYAGLADVEGSPVEGSPGNQGEGKGK